jgi:predicted nucleic acid-binding Zn finger protein
MHVNEYIGMLQDAVSQGSTGTFGIWVEEETDFVIEGAICSCVFVTEAVSE